MNLNGLTASITIGIDEFVVYGRSHWYPSSSTLTNVSVTNIVNYTINIKTYNKKY